MRKFIHHLTVVALTLAMVPTAWAWGPKTQLSIVTTAAHLLSKEGGIQLRQMDEHIREGALASQDALKEQYPELRLGDEIGAISGEMQLLQAVRGDAIDAYFAYRLGMLGKLVAQVTAPMSQEDATYRNLYYADVEERIQRIGLDAAARKRVEPKDYFTRVILEANVNNDVIAGEYEDGDGFEGLAQSSLAIDAARSVSAVADTWYTILSGRAVQGGISEEQLRNYVVDAHGYYIRAGKVAELKAAKERLAKIIEPDPDMLVRIGDLYYEAQRFDEAVAVYEKVLADMPQRRDVAERIAAYYLQKGDKALNDGRLEDAEGNFASALSSDPLHNTAEGRRLEAVGMIADRDARLEATRRALEAASQLQAMADQESLKNRYAEAAVLLRQSRDTYQSISDEFPLEYQRALNNVRDIQYRLQELRQQILANAQQFSGTGSALDAQSLADEGAAIFDKQALTALVSGAYEREMRQLEEDIRERATVN